MTILPEDPPSGDQFELSLFGRGVGESALLHMGNSRWVVVDSFKNPESGRPIALDYLERIGVRVDTDVRRVVVTHWHNDHTGGAATLLQAAAEARMVCSGALNRREFQSFIGASTSFGMENCGVEEFRRMMDIVLERQAGRTESKGPMFAEENKRIYQNEIGEIVSLSPSDGARALSLNELAGMLPRKDETKRNAVAQKPNSISVALWVRFHSSCAILGGDLECSDDSRIGWNAVISSRERPQAQAHFYKIPHHGSKNADHPDIWSELLTSNPVSCLTPKAGGAKPLPTEADVARITEHTSDLHIAGAAITKPKKFDSPVSKLLKGRERTALGGKLGMVRLRATPSGEIDIQHFGEAQPI